MSLKYPFYTRVDNLAVGDIFVCDVGCSPIDPPHSVCIVIQDGQDNRVLDLTWHRHYSERLSNQYKDKFFNSYGFNVTVWVVGNLFDPHGLGRMIETHYIKAFAEEKRNNK